HARENRIVASLDARHVHEAGGAADERSARERKLRHRLVAALGQRARAVGEALAAFEGFPHQRVSLEALKLLERVEIGVAVVEMNDEADRHQIVVEVIEERAAARVPVERPPEGVLHEPGQMLVRRNLPELLEPETELLRLAVLVETETLEQQ